MTRLLLVRHGQTVDNERQIMQGQTGGRLTPLGREQALQLLSSLSGEHIDAFVSSDLSRAMETCRILAAPSGKDIVSTPLLRERDWGSFTGRYIPSLRNEPWTSDIETIDALQLRATLFLRFIADQFPCQTILAVGHGIINKAIQSVYFGKPMTGIQKMDNAEMRTLLLDKAQSWYQRPTEG